MEHVPPGQPTSIRPFGIMHYPGVIPVGLVGDVKCHCFAVRAELNPRWISQLLLQQRIQRNNEQAVGRVDGLIEGNGHRRGRINAGTAMGRGRGDDLEVLGLYGNGQCKRQE